MTKISKNNFEEMSLFSTLTYAKSTVEYHTAVRKLSFFEAKKLIGLKFIDYIKYLLLAV